MKDFIQCAAACNEFQRWLVWGKASQTICKGEKAVARLVKLEKMQTVDYLYQTNIGQNGDISRKHGLLFCGVNDLKKNALYLTEDGFRCLTDGRSPLVTKTGPSVVEEITGKINRRVECILANDRTNLRVSEITSGQALRDLQYYQKHGAKLAAIGLFFNDQEPEALFRSGYALEELPEAAFMAWLQDPEGFIQAEAEKYIDSCQEKFLLQFLEHDALLLEYQTLIQDTGNPIHRMKAITDALNACGGKTVNVTVQKGGKALTFNMETGHMKGYRTFYSTFHVPSADRRKFERLFGCYADFNAGDVTRISYGRNTIYEAPPVQTETMTTKMGGMNFG